MHHSEIRRVAILFDVTAARYQEREMKGDDSFAFSHSECYEWNSIIVVHEKIVTRKQSQLWFRNLEISFFIDLAICTEYKMNSDILLKLAKEQLKLVPY